MEFLKPYWDYLDKPVLWLFAQLGIVPADVLLQGGKVALLVVSVLIVSGISRWLLIARSPGSSRRVRQRVSNRTSKPKVSVKAMKRAKNYVGLGDYYASVGKTAMAIDYFTKAGALEKAAEQYIHLGHPEAAAENYSEAGDNQKAAEICRSTGEWELAARYLEEDEDLQGAAEAWLHASDFDESARCYGRVLAEGKTSEAIVHSAQTLLKRMRSYNDTPTEQQRNLAASVAATMDESTAPLVVAELLEEAGDLVRAGKLYSKAGQLDRAERCFGEAGDETQVTQIRAAHKESSGDYLAAAQQYEKANQWVKAAECYLQVGNHGEAARCLEQGGELMRAAKAHANSEHWDQASRVLQTIPIDHDDYGPSRSLLSRSFYEIGDFHACLASLENELENVKVAPNNVGDFYLMAVAHEELGHLEPASEILHRVRAVSSNYRDTQERIADLSARIAAKTQAPAAMAGQTMAPPAGGPGATQAPGYSPNQTSGFVPETTEDAMTAAWEAATQVTQAGLRLFRDRYRVDHELGRGGMGVVYKAHDLELDRPVALKFLGTVSDTERFIREARAAAKLIHSHVIAIFDFSGKEGETFIAMEYLEGEGLDTYIKEHGPFEPAEAVDMVAKVCSALQAVHNLDIVHRDIKPANIVIGKTGEIKLLDFGLAKSKVDSKLTATGMIVGTPAYMPPEQVLGKEADNRTDIYAMGLVMMECLIGRVVFGQGNVLERQLTEMPPPMSELGVEVPEELEKVCLKAIAKKPEERYQNAEDFAKALLSVSLD